MRMNSTELLWAHISASLVLLPNQSNVSSFYCMMTSIPLIGLELGCVHIGGKKLIKFLHLAEKVYLLLKMNLFVVLQTRSWNNGNRFILGCCKKRSRSVPKSPHIWGKTHARFGKSGWRSICNIGCTCLQVSLSLLIQSTQSHTFTISLLYSKTNGISFFVSNSDSLILLFRQVMAACKLVWNSEKQIPWYFVKEISSDGDLSTVDVIYPA